MSAYAEKLAASAQGLGAWRDLPFFGGPECQGAGFARVIAGLSTETARVLPDSDAVFAAFGAVQPEAVRVVILGQDPYPTPGHAHGFAFSVEPDVMPLPRSLLNIYKEMDEDVGARPATGDLRGWAAQGVMLLNSALTVKAGDAGSHARIGWSDLIGDAIKLLSSLDNLVWILWGKHAQSFRDMITSGSGQGALILESAHPSPLSARRGFFGSKPFSRTNTHLKNNDYPPIDWTS